jgi:uncharacterized protein YdiU (UPF0061 family)
MRSLSSIARGGVTNVAELVDSADFQTWKDEWNALLKAQGRAGDAVATQMDAKNPAYIPRNHIVEMALAAGASGDLSPLVELVALLKDPYRTHDGMDAYTSPMPADWEGYQTFCGT